MNTECEAEKNSKKPAKGRPGGDNSGNTTSQPFKKKLSTPKTPVKPCLDSNSPEKPPAGSHTNSSKKPSSGTTPKTHPQPSPTKGENSSSSQGKNVKTGQKSKDPKKTPQNPTPTDPKGKDPKKTPQNPTSTNPKVKKQDASTSSFDGKKNRDSHKYETPKKPSKKPPGSTLSKEAIDNSSNGDSDSDVSSVCSSVRDSDDSPHSPGSETPHVSFEGHDNRVAPVGRTNSVSSPQTNYESADDDGLAEPLPESP